MDVLVIDNNSSDGTPDLVSSHFPGLRLIRMESNLGYGAACNLAAAASTSEYIAVVNQDVVSIPNWLDILIDALDGNCEAGLATPKILIRSNPALINTCGNAAHYTGVTRCRGFLRAATEYGLPEEVVAVSGAAFVIRRAVFNALGGFDPSFFLYFEDTDLSLRARLAGYRCLYVPQATVFHEFTPRFSPQKVFLLEKNRYATWLKLFRWRSLILLSPALLLTDLATWGYCLFSGTNYLAAKARSWLDLLKHLPEILRHRRQTQLLRRAKDCELLRACTSRLELDELEHIAVTFLQPALNVVYEWWHRRLLELVRW